MAAPAFVAQTEGVVALAAAGTAKTILNVVAASGKKFVPTEIGVSFDGVTASEKPILVELCRSTQATAGTSTSVTPRQVRGDGNVTVTSSAAKNYTAEPTVLTPIREWLIDPYKGSFVMQLPLGREPEPLAGNALCLRMTIQTGGAAVSTRAYIEFEE